MDRQTFVALLTEEGLTSREAEIIWEHRASMEGELTPERVRAAARATLPMARSIRNLGLSIFWEDVR